MGIRQLPHKYPLSFAPYHQHFVSYKRPAVVIPYLHCSSVEHQLDLSHRPLKAQRSPPSYIRLCHLAHGRSPQCRLLSTTYHSECRPREIVIHPHSSSVRGERQDSVVTVNHYGVLRPRPAAFLQSYSSTPPLLFTRRPSCQFTSRGDTGLRHASPWSRISICGAKRKARVAMPSLRAQQEKYLPLNNLSEVLANWTLVNAIFLFLR